MHALGIRTGADLRKCTGAFLERDDVRWNRSLSF
jgi:hypothetical protein